jgi:hypothetical protein
VLNLENLGVVGQFLSEYQFWSDICVGSERKTTLNFMLILCTLNLPEHTTIIENYPQILGELVLYPIEWPLNTLPRIGESLDGEIVNGHISAALKDSENLPQRWQITDVKWIMQEGQLCPMLHLVGKWGHP